MKIGILTYHRSHNFGALLQAIALRKVLTNNGHKVSYIDYWPDYHVAMYSLFSWKAFKRQNLKGKCSYTASRILGYRTKAPSYRKFNEFIKKYIEPYCEPLGTPFDLILYGSDQIWRKQPWLNTYNPVYFGVHSSQARIHASYAASMGILPEEKDTDDCNTLRSLLPHLDYISVRESNLLELIKKMGASNARQSVDPTLLLTSEQWDAILPKPINLTKTRKSYVLFVNYIPNSFNEEELRIFASQNNLDFIKVNGTVLNRDTSDAIIGASPQELVDFIRNSTIVFTSSFHALIFALIYGKTAYASFKKNGDRAKFLLNSLDLSSFYLEEHASIPSDIPQIDKGKIRQRMKELTEPSINYLSYICNL